MLGTILTLNFLGYVATFVAGGFFFTKVMTWIKAQIAKI